MSNYLRNTVCYCPTCNRETDKVCRENDTVLCTCGTAMEQHWWKRTTRDATVWHPSEWATVFRKPDGTFSYPMKAEKPTPAGCERIIIRSDADAARHESESGTRMERRWFDYGSGNGFDTRPLPELPFRVR